MSEEKFTPPPWSVPSKGNLRGAVVAKDGEMVCDPSGAGRHEDEAEANAKLCAVAPEMYLLLQMLFDEIRRNIWSDQRRKLYMARILKVQTWAMNGREWERE